MLRPGLSTPKSPGHQSRVAVPSAFGRIRIRVLRNVEPGSAIYQYKENPEQTIVIRSGQAMLRPGLSTLKIGLIKKARLSRWKAPFSYY